MNNLLRILVLSHLGTSLFMYGAAQPARESQAQEINFKVIGSTIHISYDAPTPPTKTQIEKIGNRLQELQNNIPKVLAINPSWKITEVHINASSVDLNPFVNFLRFFPYVEELKIEHTRLTWFDESEAENLTKTIQSYAPQLKVLSVLNCRIGAQAWNKLIEGLKNAPHLESLEIEFDSIKELEVPLPPKPPQSFYERLFSEEVLNTSSTQKCSELLASLPCLKLLKIRAGQGYKPGIYRELFKHFSATNIQQIEIDDSGIINARKLSSIDWPRLTHKRSNSGELQTYVEKARFHIQKNENNELEIIVNYCNIYHESTGGDDSSW